VDDEQPLDEDSGFLELPGVDPEEAEEAGGPLDASDAEPFDPREVDVVDEEDLPGEPIDPDLPEDEMRQEARRWVGRDLGRTSLSAKMTEDGEHLFSGSEPIGEEELRLAEMEELKERKEEISGHKREASRRWSELPYKRKDVPETVKQKKRALLDEQKAAEAHIEQIEAEIERRPTKAESKIRSALEEAGRLERVLEKEAVEDWLDGEKSLNEFELQEKRIRRAQALGRAERRLGRLGAEERQEIRQRIEENKPRLAETLEEAEDPSRPSAAQVRTRVATSRIRSDLETARRAEERGQEAHKHDVLDRAKRRVEELSTKTDMTKREAQKAVAEGLSRDERSLLRKATDPGRPSAEEIRDSRRSGPSKTGGRGESSGLNKSSGSGESSDQGEGSDHGERSSPGEGSSPDTDSSEEKSQGEDESRGLGYDRGPGL